VVDLSGLVVVRLEVGAEFACKEDIRFKDYGVGRGNNSHRALPWTCEAVACHTCRSIPNKEQSAVMLGRRRFRTTLGQEQCWASLGEDDEVLSIRTRWTSSVS
jgi:hypothetical protein